MSEPLTDIQLRALETITKTPLIGLSLAQAAASEIRKLRRLLRVSPIHEMPVWEKLNRLKADNARLREALGEYGGHKHSCFSWFKEIPGAVPRRCDCGLEEALREPDKLKS